MKVIILAGGLGTRISEETADKPKPMVLLDDKPIIWHIMNIFATQGITDFMIATGYLGYVIQEWVEHLDTPWRIRALDTGETTMTGGRIRQCLHQIGNETTFVTYGDGLGNINLKRLLSFHQNQKRIATVTAVRPPARFGVLESQNGQVIHFGEKRQTDAGWINGGYFVVDPGILKYIENDTEPFETGALPRLVDAGELSAYEHTDFWQPMDTLREKNQLTLMAKSGKPPWLNLI
jgi:glucose-1-phosphate cytidylyltransferase